MKRLLLSLVLLLAMASAALAEIVVVGPTEPIPAGGYAFLQVQGLTPENLPKATVTVKPPGPQLMPLADWSGKPMLFFSTQKAGSYTVTVAVNAWSASVDEAYTIVKAAPIDDKDEPLRKAFLASSAELSAAYRAEIGSCVIQVGDPDPPPPPPPPPPSEKKQIVFFVETADLDNLPAAQRNMLGSLVLRDEMSSAGHKFLGQWDDDTPPNAKNKPWYEAIQGDPMPRIAIAPLEGGDIVDYPLPADEDALWALIGGKP